MDAPSIEEQDALELAAGFESGPIGPEICGFQIPGFSYNLGFKLRLPTFFFQFPPTFFFALGLQCDLSNPVDLTYGYGGGRVGYVPPEIDADFA